MINHLLKSFILASILSLNLYSQPSFFQIHSDHVTAQVEINKVVAHKNDYYILGQYENSVAYNQIITQSPSRNQFLMKINSDGTHQWTKTFGDVNLVSTRNLVVTNDGTIYLSGLFSDSLHFDNQSIGTTFPFQEFLVELDSMGEFIKSIPIQINSKRNAVFFLFENNNNIVVGFKGNDSIVIDSQHTFYPDYMNGDFLIFLNYDRNGNIIKTDKVESKGSIGRTHASTSSSGSIMLNFESDNSDTIYFNATPIAIDSSSSVIISQLDNNFQTSNTLQLKREGIVGMTYHGFSTANQHLFTGAFTGRILKDTFSISNLDYPPNTVSLGDGFALILNNDFSISKLFSLGAKGNNLSLGGILSHSQQYIVSGSTSGAVILNGDTVVNEPFTTTFLAVVDEFSKLSDVNHNTGNPPIPSTRNSGMIEGVNGEIVVFGSANSDITFTRSTDTLFRRSSRVGFIWFFDSYLALQEWQSKQQDLSLHPNPSRHWVELTVELESPQNLHIQLISLDGKNQSAGQHFAARGEKGSNTLRYPTSALPAGLYLLQVRAENGTVLGQEKLVLR